MKISYRWGWAVLCLVTAACVGGDDSTDGLATDGSCQPGRSEECICSGGDRGSRDCVTIGGEAAFGDCHCEEEVGDGDGDRTGDGDPPGDGDGDVTGDGDGDLVMRGDGDGDGDGNAAVVLLYEPFDAGFGNWVMRGTAWDGDTAPDVYPVGGSGDPVAHADNCDAEGCWMELAVGLDLRPYSRVRLEFLRHIDSSLDNDEYLYVEVYNGSMWLRLFEWFGDGDDDDNWHSVIVELEQTVGLEIGTLSDFKIRFGTNASSGLEDIYIDDVRVTGYP